MRKLHVNLYLCHNGTSFLLSHFSEIIDRSCTNSTACQVIQKGFCNFDYGDYGFCEPCTNIGDEGCENSGLPQQKGKDECKNNCEGKEGLTRLK